MTITSDTGLGQHFAHLASGWAANLSGDSGTVHNNRLTAQRLAAGHGVAQHELSHRRAANVAETDIKNVHVGP